MILRTTIATLLATLAVSSVSAEILHDWNFAGLRNGSTFSSVPDTGTIGGLTFLDNAGSPGTFNNSRVVDGKYRISRRLSGTTSFYADIADQTASSKPVWAVLELAGWNMKSATNQIVRFDFTTTTTGTQVAAQARLDRAAKDNAALSTVTLVGAALGDGGQSAPGNLELPSAFTGPIRIALMFDKAKGVYEVSYLLPGAAAYVSLGQGRISPARDGNALRININGSYSTSGEYLDISRIYLSSTAPTP